jgi:hypothetical protein
MSIIDEIYLRILKTEKIILFEMNDKRLTDFFFDQIYSSFINNKL